MTCCIHTIILPDNRQPKMIVWDVPSRRSVARILTKNLETVQEASLFVVSCVCSIYTSMKTLFLWSLDCKCKPKLSDVVWSSFEPTALFEPLLTLLLR